MLAGLPPLPMPLQTHGAYTAEGEYIPGSGGGVNGSSHFGHPGGGGPSMMYGGGGGMGGGQRHPMMQQPHHQHHQQQHHPSHFNDNHSDDGGYGLQGYEGHQQQHRPSPMSYRPAVPMPPPPARLVGYGSNDTDNDYFDNDNASISSNNNNNMASAAGYPRSSGGGGGTAQQSALRQLHQLHQQSGHGSSPGYHPAQSIDHHHRGGGNNNYRLPPGSASNAGYRMGGSGSSTHSMSTANTSAHGGGPGNPMGGYALALGGAGMGSNNSSNGYGQRPPPLHAGSPLDYRSTNGGSMHSNSSSGGEAGLTSLGGGIFGSGGMAAPASSSQHNDPSSSSSSGGMGLGNMGSLFSALGGGSGSGGMASGDDQEWQRALGLAAGGGGGDSGITNPSMHQLTSYSGTSKSTATTVESLDNNSNDGGSSQLFRAQRASVAAAVLQQQQLLSSFSSNLGGLTDGSAGHEHLAVGNKTSPLSMQQPQQQQYSGGGFMSSFDDPSLPDHNNSSGSSHPVHNDSSTTTKDPNQQPLTLRSAGSLGGLGSQATDDFDDDGEGAMAHPPLDKWMIKVWLPLVFEGFEYDLIDSFVNRLRDDGGFVTVQDLLDAQARGELSRQSLADIAAFKVGHCNRLDRSLSIYTTNNNINNKAAVTLPATSSQELASPVAVASARKEANAPANTAAVAEDTEEAATGDEAGAAGVGANTNTDTDDSEDAAAAAQSSPASGGGAINRRPSIRALVVEKPLQ